MSEDERECVEFGNKASAFPGALAGAAIAIGVPGATMILGKSLASGAQLTIILVGIGVGGLIALTSTFFSLVIPSKVNGYGGCGCGKPKQTVGGNTVEQTF
jgi:hypothetical protein